MTITSLSSSDFNRWASEAKRAANKGPVFITDRGRPAHVLMNFDTYKQLTKQRRNIADALAMEAAADMDFDPARMTIEIKAADLP